MRTCDTLRCAHGAVCVDDNGMANCVCPSACDSDALMEQVCGSDGVTYGSQCQLQQTACRQQRDIRVTHVGPCTGNGLPDVAYHHTTSSCPNSSIRPWSRGFVLGCTRHVYSQIAPVALQRVTSRKRRSRRSTASSATRASQIASAIPITAPASMTHACAKRCTCRVATERAAKVRAKCHAVVTLSCNTPQLVLFRSRW